VGEMREMGEKKRLHLPHLPHSTRVQLVSTTAYYTSLPQAFVSFLMGRARGGVAPKSKYFFKKIYIMENNWRGWKIENSLWILNFRES
jgi:hypothetical protein